MAGNPSLIPPFARCLDLSRLVSRVGRGPASGIDRVERAYLEHLLNLETGLFALVRTSLGFVLLDREGTSDLAARLRGEVPWGAPDLLSRLFLKADLARRRAESDLRRLALARTGRQGLARMLAAHLPEGCAYINVGHSNLQPHVFEAVRAVPGARITVMIHDTIPLDLPELQRPGTTESFKSRLRWTGSRAGLVLYNSHKTRTDAERYFNEWGRVPPGLVAHLGVELPQPDPAALPCGLNPDNPYFVCVGTIEPRKNHTLLLDIWEWLEEELPAEKVPPLYIVGRRGWNNEDMFARLDTSPLMGRHVFELGGLSDGAMAALVQGALAMLFPSLDEGFGLPPCEAVMLGVPVVVNDAPIYREILGNIPIYASRADMYSWRNTIKLLIEQHEAGQSRGTGASSPVKLPDWRDHFNQVLKVT
jgi:glycosyltransferase involved in cell wall biosynthesis